MSSEREHALIGHGQAIRAHGPSFLDCWARLQIMLNTVHTFCTKVTWERAYGPLGIPRVSVLKAAPSISTKGIKKDGGKNI